MNCSINATKPLASRFQFVPFPCLLSEAHVSIPDQHNKAYICT
ncbi:hypothetical protein V6Z11_A11G077800 [Gossypium hirsutum]